MSVNAIGRAVFEDSCIPLKGKSEWGMDTLTRQVTGARSLAEAYIATLAQGQTYGTAPNFYYLQTWEPDENPQVATITLNYKGLITGGTPLPDIQTQISPASGSISKSYVGENGGLGRNYRTQPLYSLDFGITAAIGQEDTQYAFRKIYATGVTMEFTYDAIQTVYRYITLGKPDRPKYYTVDIPRIPVVKRARYTTSDGSVYGINAPIALTTDLSPDILNRVVGFTAKNVIGSPYYECEDVVRRELGEGDADNEGSFGG